MFSSIRFRPSLEPSLLLPLGPLHRLCELSHGQGITVDDTIFVVSNEHGPCRIAGERAQHRRVWHIVITTSEEFFHQRIGLMQGLSVQTD
jgi:hypothetical protein